MSRRATVLFASLIGVLGNCHRSSVPTAAAPEPPVDSGPDAESELVPARCHRTDLAFALADGQGRDDLEIGDAVVYPAGYAVGIVHRTSAGRVAGLALVERELRAGGLKVVDLGPTLGDAPPPRVAYRSPDLVAAAYVRRTPPNDATRDVTLSTISGDEANGGPLVVAQQRDDSLAFDLAFAGSTGLLVWDEATSPAGGIIKASVFSKEQAAQGRVISPPDSDAELPRAVAYGSGFAVIWIARRPDSTSEVDASATETTGEARMHGWLEMVPVDRLGSPMGPVRRLTPNSGHVSAFDVEARSAGTDPLLVLVARDDGETVDGSGGSLLRVRVKGDTVEPLVAFATDGLGRGAPTFVSSSVASVFALTWIGKQEQIRLLPLDPSGAPASSPSLEDAMDDARPLHLLSPPPGAAKSPLFALVATPSDAAAQLRLFACASFR